MGHTQIDRQRREGEGKREASTGPSSQTILLWMCVCVPAVDEVNEPATIYQQKHIEKEGERERRREEDRQRGREGAHTL